jgi:uncharacterized protein YjbI with pentapeptide repeats
VPQGKRQNFVRDGADLPQDLQEMADGNRLFSGPDVEIAEQLITGLKLEAAAVGEFRIDSSVLHTVALPGSAIRSAKWKDVRFTGCDLANIEIRALTAVRVEFHECRMTGLRVGQADWQNLLISGGDQRYAQFRFSVFRAAEFDGCDFQDADFYGADLRACLFRRCNLRNAEMSKTKLTGADLRGSIVEGLRLGAEDIAGAIVDAAQALAFAPLLGIRIL